MRLLLTGRRKLHPHLLESQLAWQRLGFNWINNKKQSSITNRPLLPPLSSLCSSSSPSLSSSPSISSSSFPFRARQRDNAEHFHAFCWIKHGENSLCWVLKLKQGEKEYGKKKRRICTIPPLLWGPWRAAERFFTIKKICSWYSALRIAEQDRPFFFSTNWPGWEGLSAVVGQKQPITEALGWHRTWKCSSESSLGTFSSHCRRCKSHLANSLLLSHTHTHTHTHTLSVVFTSLPSNWAP